MAYHLFYSSDDLQNKVMETLSLLGIQEGPSHTLVRMHNGQPTPGLVVEWFKGSFCAHEIKNYLEEFLEELCEQEYFTSEREYRLVRNTISLMFTPHKLASSMVPLKKMKRLLKKLAAITDKQGNPVHQFFIISNFDKESFELTYKANPTFFSYFERKNIIISGEVGLVKPHQSIFEYCLTTFELDPEDCLFIDDQIENISGAQVCGIEGFHYNKHEHIKLEKKLKKEMLL
jgi:putative hydrolase of the HAD superfamily